MPGLDYSIRVAEIVYEIHCRKCDKVFYIKTDAGHLTEIEVLYSIWDWGCEKHPEESLIEMCS